MHDDEWYASSRNRDADFMAVVERDEMARELRHDDAALLGGDRGARGPDDGSGEVARHTHSVTKVVSATGACRGSQPQYSSHFVTIAVHLRNEVVVRIELQLVVQSSHKSNLGFFAV